MFILLKTFLKHKDEYQGEALLEFMYALSIGKLRLHKFHYDLLIEEMKSLNDPKINLFLKQIEALKSKRYFE